MLPAFVEAIRATTQPCTLLLVLPAVVMVLVTSGRWAAFAAICLGAIGGGWLLVGNVVALSDAELRLSGAIVAVAIATAIALPYVPRLPPLGCEVARVMLAGGVSFVATLWWRPCVGSELGAILTAARRGVIGQLPGMAAYMLGAMVPVLAVVLAIRSVDPSPASTRRVAWIAGAAGLVVASALAFGRHDELVATLTRWTTA